MPPTPEQIAREQMLEVFVRVEKTQARMEATAADARLAIPAAVASMLEEHRQQVKTEQPASDQRVIAAVVAKLTPKFSNGDIIDRIDLWCSVITAVIVAGVCILIVLVVHH